MYRFFRGPILDKVPNLQIVADNLEGYFTFDTKIIHSQSTGKAILCDSKEIILKSSQYSWEAKELPIIASAFKAASSITRTPTQLEELLSCDSYGTGFIPELPIQINTIIAAFLVNAPTFQWFSFRVFLSFRQMYYPDSHMSVSHNNVRIQIKDFDLYFASRNVLKYRNMLCIFDHEIIRPVGMIPYDFAILDPKDEFGFRRIFQFC